jgi:hypothetical protein
MGNSKKEKELKEVEEIVERFKNLTDQELIDRRSLFGGPLKKEFKIAINQILKSRGLDKRNID